MMIVKRMRIERSRFMRSPLGLRAWQSHCEDKQYLGPAHLANPSATRRTVTASNLILRFDTILLTSFDPKVFQRVGCHYYTSIPSVNSTGLPQSMPSSPRLRT